MMTESRPKPTLEKFVAGVRSQFPDTEITDGEIERLRSRYDEFSRKDLVKAFTIVSKAPTFNPLSAINRQLRIIRPPVDPMSTQATYNWQGKHIEHGTDWDKKIAEKPKVEYTKEQARYDSQWFINLDYILYPDEDLKYVKLDDESDAYFQSLRKKLHKDQPKAKPQKGKVIKDPEWFDKEIYYPLFGEHYKEEN